MASYPYHGGIFQVDMSGSPQPPPQNQSPESIELEIMTRQFQIFLPLNMYRTLLPMGHRITFMDVCLNGYQQLSQLLGFVEDIDYALHLMEGTGRTRFSDQLLMHRQATDHAAMKLRKDLTNFERSLGHIMQPDGLEERAWKM
ncbi:hypothetical protein ACHAPT_010652 [Fusarium lateritium]